MIARHDGDPGTGGACANGRDREQHVGTGATIAGLDQDVGRGEPSKLLRPPLLVFRSDDNHYVRGGNDAEGAMKRIEKQAAFTTQGAVLLRNGHAACGPRDRTESGSGASGKNNDPRSMAGFHKGFDLDGMWGRGWNTMRLPPGCRECRRGAWLANALAASSGKTVSRANWR
jgi:hypothetical protein